MPADAQVGAFHTFLSNTVLLEDYLPNILARHVVLIVDSCFSGSLFKELNQESLTPTEQNIRNMMLSRSRLGIAAGSIELVSDGLVGNHSPFASSLIHQLRENQRSYLPVLDLFHPVSQMTTYSADQRPVYGVLAKSKHVPGAQFVLTLKRDETRDWTAAQAENSIAAYHQFLVAYPQSTHADAAVWQIACLLDSKAAYRGYLDAQAQGQHRLSASQRILAIEDRDRYQDALELGEGGLLVFVEQYRNSAYRAEALAEIQRIRSQEQQQEQEKRLREETIRLERQREAEKQRREAEETQRRQEEAARLAREREAEKQRQEAEEAAEQEAARLKAEAEARIARAAQAKREQETKQHKEEAAAKEKVRLQVEAKRQEQAQQQRRNARWQQITAMGWRIPAGAAALALLIFLGWWGTMRSPEKKPDAQLNLAETEEMMPEIATPDISEPASENPVDSAPLLSLTLLGSYHQGIARYEESGKTGYVKQNGVRLTPARYDKGEDFEHGAAIVHLNDKRGYIDLSGQEILSPRYDVAWNFNAQGLARVKQGGRTFLIDKAGAEQKIDLPLPEMVRVRGGTFTMGDGGNYRVTVSDFYIGKYEVTQAQWRAVMGTSPSNFKDCDQCPVEQVSWNDVQAFIQKLNAQTGQSYRLPTEAEWEYAAGGGLVDRNADGSRKYTYAGSENLDEVAWYSGNSGSKTHPVGQKKENGLKLYDMSGNVWEWCADWYGDYPSGAQTNPRGPSQGSGRVIRGGSWYFNPVDCRVAYRNYYGPGNRLGNVGFRLAR